ncbi:hypothetical protein OHD62_22945 [Mesorhizobium sp. YC-39]|uniref:hypothetical protein n=1 Tax=unclassified Mesorhizobium TaxID=325217 RepID=UPI0021E86A83|nr:MULTISPECIES: hypothetical protein [unclassified Mesorhizobium]MCV3209409.1 hypothetical protein [Mesorhizobium sp. YC-2]MCV3231241.1 hypothetical protein [Mesorhizobium sp. YC-39]
MTLPGKEATIADVVSIAVECIDCGRNRWWKPAELRRHGVSGQTPLVTLSERLVCKSCRADGLPGRAVAIQAAFIEEHERRRIDAQRRAEREAPLKRSRRA